MAGQRRWVDVLLVNPPWYKRTSNIWRFIDSSMPPLGLASIAACLRKHDVSVDIVDFAGQGLGLSDAPRVLAEYEMSWLGITAVTGVMAQALEVARVGKRLNPGAKVVFGGVHPSLLSAEVVRQPGVDYVVRGEGETAFLELIRAGSPEGVESVTFMKDGEVVENPQAPPIADLDALPWPAYDLLLDGRNHYRPARGGYRRLPAISMLTTRGCPGRCTFCNGGFFGRRIRGLSAQTIAAQMDWLKRQFNIQEICFYDDTFTYDRERILELCQRLLVAGTELTWSCFSRVDFVDREILEAMSRAGCHQIMYGVESASPAILQNMRKRISLDRVPDVVRWTQAAHIDVRLAFMLGSPGETPVTARATLDWAVELDPELTVFNITTPYPGTEMFRWAKKEGYLATNQWSEYDLAHPVMQLPTISSSELRRLYRLAYLRFYLRPKALWRLVRRELKESGWRRSERRTGAFFPKHRCG